MTESKSDANTTIADLTELIRAFTHDRDWNQFHHPKDLGVALTIEVGELLEHFRYRTDSQIREYLQKRENRAAVSHEVADCMWLLLRMADVVDFDVSSALREKLVLAAKKYPIEKVRGRPDKYTAYLGEGG